MLRTRDFGLQTLYVRLDDEILGGSFAVATENARGFEFFLTDTHGELADTTGAVVKLSQRKNGKLYQSTAEAKDEKKGHYIVLFAPDALVTAGEMDVQFIISKDGETLKSAPQKISVYPALDATTAGGGSVLIDFAKLDEAVKVTETIVADAKKIKEDTEVVAKSARETKETVDKKAEEVAANAKEVRETKETFKEIATSESARKEAETARQDAETKRVSAEAERATAESERKANEAARIAKESARQEAETTRANEEETRKANEAARIAAEKARAEEETKRKAAEEERASKETARSDAEQGRKEAETARTSAEESRVDAESARQEAETKRAEAEKARATAEGKRDTAESARASAETERESKEQARITAEGKRASAETTRKSAEDERIATQAQNHQTATEDHAKITAALEVIKSLETGQMVAQIAALQATVEKDTKRLDTLLEGATDETLDQIAELAQAIKNGGTKLTALTEQLATKATADELKAAREALEKQIGTKANASDLASGLAGKVDTATHTVDLSKKADKTTVETMQTEAQTHYTDASVTGETLRLIRKNGDETAITLPKGFSGNYNDLTDAPNLGIYQEKANAFSGKYADLTGSPDLTIYQKKAEAFSGAYGDLTGSPDLSVYERKADAFSGRYADLTGTPNLNLYQMKESGKGLSSRDFTADKDANLADLDEMMGYSMENKDDKGNYKKITYTRASGKVYAICNFVGTYPYPRYTVTRYKANGITVKDSLTYALTWDTDENRVIRAVRV